MRKAIIFALAFLLLMPLARADTYLTDCAELNVTGETYYLTQDIINSTATTCMNISANNVIFDCQGHTIDGTDTSDTYGIYVYRSPATTTNITIKNCVMTDWNVGIYLDSSNSNNLSNITANSNSEYGIYLTYSNSSTLSNITANSNTYDGICLDSSNSSTLSNITANSNTYDGIYLDAYSDFNILSNIIANSNSQYGISLSYSEFNTLSNIIANSNSYGIHLELYSNSNNLSNITANSNTYDGIYLGDSDSNAIKNSIIQNNSQYGIYLYSAGNPANSIYNNLFNNTANFYFSGTIYANNWNTTRQTGTRIYSFGNEIGGNYWTNATANGYSDTCTDTDKDGFCDDPYVLATDNVDYLALSDEYITPTTTTLPPVSGVPLLSRTLVGIAIGFGVLAFMLKTLFDINAKEIISNPEGVIMKLIALAVIVTIVVSLIVLFA
jgi:parallel beta-helix repeat protein